MDIRKQAREYVKQMTPEEKAALCVGADFWHLHAVERLGLPSIMVADGPHGLRKQIAHYDSARPSDSVPATCFPTASAAACTFDPELLYQMGRAIGEECRAEDVSVLLGPGVNMKRSPLGGRNFEYFSEDPYLAGTLAAGMIRGVQSVGVGTSLKHFALNSQETARFVVDSVVDERALREVYLRAFEIAVKEGKPWTVMTAYNKLNGAYCGEHPELLEILRREWGFDGVTLSDWGAVHEIVDSIAAGLDVEMPGVKNGHIGAILHAVQTGNLKPSMLDAAAERVTALILKAQEGKKRPYTCDFGAHHALAKTIARSAAVLLKNDGILPGNRRQQAAVIGALAREGRYQGAGSSKVHPHQLDSAWEALHRALPTAEYAPGYALRDDAAHPELIGEAVAAARGKEIVYLFAGLPEAWESEGFDRAGLQMPSSHNALIEAVCRANPNTVVILQAGSPVEMPWIDLPRAVLLLYLGGEGGGSAAAELLLGGVSPSGKLAETFPVSLADTPAASRYPAANRVAEHRESIYIGYRYYDAAEKEVLFPFGHGLSYTTFAYSTIEAELGAEDTWSVRCRVKNTGAVPAAEIVQLYLAPCAPVVYRAKQELIGFTKIDLLPGEEKEASFAFTRRDVSYYSIQHQRFAVEEGAYELRIGASSRDIRLRRTIFISGDVEPEDLREALPHYYAPLSGTFPGKEFEHLLGHAVPPWERPQRGSYTLNVTLRELGDFFTARMLRWAVRLWIKQQSRGDVRRERRIWELVLDTPLRQTAMLGISVGKAAALVDLCNGKYWKVLRDLLT